MKVVMYGSYIWSAKNSNLQKNIVNIMMQKWTWYGGNKERICMLIKSNKTYLITLLITLWYINILIWYINILIWYINILIWYIKILMWYSNTQMWYSNTQMWCSNTQMWYSSKQMWYSSKQMWYSNIIIV